MAGLRHPPSPHTDNISALADFAELECLHCADFNVSDTDLVRAIQRAHDGREEDRVTALVEQAFSELADRRKHCGDAEGRYPYELLNDGSLLQYLNGAGGNTAVPLVYLFLLLSTRLDMKAQRVQAGVDATAQFEVLCCEVAKRYWGGPNTVVKGLVFGTGRMVEGMQDDDDFDRGSFVAAVDHLCKQLGEGHKFHADPTSRITAKDGKLDVVVWRQFADGRAGKLIGFGQCKTGTYWTTDLLKLRPEGFCQKWMLKAPAVNPVRMYFVADRVPLRQWYDRNVDAGILFDRCRIMEYAVDLPPKLMTSLARWVTG